MLQWAVMAGNTGFSRGNLKLGQTLFQLNPGKQVFPFLELVRWQGAPISFTQPQSFVIETEYGQKVLPLFQRQHTAGKVIQHHGLRRIRGLVAKHHVISFPGWNTHMDQAKL
jgi:hypothetical protein